MAALTVVAISGCTQDEGSEASSTTSAVLTVPDDAAETREGVVTTDAGHTSAPPPPPPPPTLLDAAPGLQGPRRDFALPAPVADDVPPGDQVTVRLGTAGDLGGPRLTTANVGLSFEATELADPRWEPGSSTLDLLISALDRPALRFGGNSVDRRVWWTSSDEPAPRWAEATITPEDLDRLGRFARQHDASVTLVVDLGNNDPERAADYISHASRSLGDHLVAISIGNEPNGFNLGSQPQYRIRDDSWGPEDFVKEATAYVEAIHARTPGVAIIGPGAFDAPWWRAFAEAELPETLALAQHWYPLWNCDGDKEPRAEPTLENILDPWLHDRADFIIGMGIDHGERYGLPVWMEETGPTSCQGTNETSRTHAQALWTVDFILHGAELGVTRMNQHGMLGACRGGAPMSPTCDSAPKGETSDLLLGQANYLAMLQVANLREGPFRELDVDGDEKVFGYAVSDDDGTDLVLVNVNDPDEVGSSTLSLELPEGLTPSHASLLTAPGLAAIDESRLTPWEPVRAGTEWSLPAGSSLAVRLEP